MDRGPIKLWTGDAHDIFLGGGGGGIEGMLNFLPLTHWQNIPLPSLLKFFQGREMSHNFNGDWAFPPPPTANYSEGEGQNFAILTVRLCDLVYVERSELLNGGYRD